MKIIGERIVAAFAGMPGAGGWLQCALGLVIYAVVALPLGFYFGFLKTEVLSSRLLIFGVIFGALFRPAITEELFFRVMLLPHISEQVSPAIMGGYGLLSLILFIGYHPLNAITFFKGGKPTFFEPIFLFLAGFLGVICTLVYWGSGSIWPPVVIHWLVVVVWLLLLGGYDRLYRSL